MFKRVKKHICQHEYELVGLFYKENFTQYRNSFDEVNAYKKYKCKKCFETNNVLISSEDFMPELYKGRDRRKDDYILRLKNKGFKSEVDLYV